MFEQEPKASERRTFGQKLTTVLLLPFGVAAAWLELETTTKLKVLALIFAIGLGAAYFLVFRNPAQEQAAHYDALEQQRAEQRQAFATQPDTTVSQPDAAQPATTPAASPGQSPVAANQPATAPAANAPVPLSNAPANKTAPAPQAKPNTAPPAPPPAREYWTDFRGPLRDGNYTETAIKTSWGKGLTPVWKQPVGVGFASFVVGEGRVYTIEQRRNQEVAAAYDLATGRELWTNAWEAKFSDSTGDGPRATPTYEAGRVYALGAEGELRALDAKTGKPIWNKNILSDNGASNIDWGVSAAPLIVDDKVIVMAGGGGGKSIVAYNKANGARVWSVLDDGSSYTSPMLVTLGGKRQILAVTGTRMVGLTPENGALLWQYAWANSYKINVSQPIVVDANHIFISAGYGKGAALVQIAGNTARTVWENQNMKNKFNSSVLYNGYVYGLDEGILSCVDVKTGERKWKGGRYGYGQLLLASGHLVVLADDGRLALVQATPEAHKEVTVFQALSGKTWNVPALTGGKLLVRNATEMACFNLLQ